MIFWTGAQGADTVSGGDGDDVLVGGDGLSRATTLDDWKQILATTNPLAEMERLGITFEFKEDSQ